MSTVTRHKTTDPARLVKEVRERLGVTRKILSRLTGYSERALAGWEGGQPLRGPSLQRMLELRRLSEGLGRVMKRDYIGPWVETPNAAFDGLKPLEVIERGENDRIWRMIFELESGMPT